MIRVVNSVFQQYRQLLLWTVVLLLIVLIIVLKTSSLIGFTLHPYFLMSVIGFGFFVCAVKAIFWLKKSIALEGQSSLFPQTTPLQSVNTKTLIKSSKGAELNAFKKSIFIEAMREIDRAILSNTNFDRLIKVIFAYSRKIIPSTFVSFSSFSQDEKTLQNTYIETENGQIRKIMVNVDKSIRLFFSRFPEGGVVEGVTEYTFMQAFATFKAARYLVHPTYKDGQVDGMLVLGLAENVQLTEFELAAARDFSDRLGVVKTAAARDKDTAVQDYYDSITQLLNRQACYERLSQEIARARRQASKLAIFYFNLNDFKKINEIYGNFTGDFVLKETAERLKSNVREADVISRLSADEFLVIISDIEKMGNASVIANKIIGLFAETFDIAGHQIQVSIRLGISFFPDDGITADELIQHANMAMQSTKKTSELGFMFYEPSMSNDAIWKAKMYIELQQALRNNEFFLVYQPQVCSRTARIIGVEALIRWQHPERGLVSPGEFISVCEDTALILQMGEQVRRMACAQYNSWLEAGVKPPKISLNVSTMEIRRQEFATEFDELLLDTGVPTSAFELEVTETMLVESEGNVIKNLTALSEMGVKIALDDFGTGYSNLSYLIRLPFDVLKVDRSFVMGIGKQAGSTQIVSMIIDMAHHLGKVVVAEGVETEVQRKFLVESGCDVMQGYLLSKPLLSDDLVELLNSKAEISVKNSAYEPFIA